MTLSIGALPHELLSAILQDAASLTNRENANFTYGLSQAPEPLQDVNMQRVVRGHVPVDTANWNAVDAIRRVNRRWHDWAAQFALKDLYITRWRGSERWMQSRGLSGLHQHHSSIAVYRDPYHSLRQTLQLFTSNPALATYVRRVWFDGYYSPETTAMIFDILQHCNRLKYVILPWTALRYGDADRWLRLLSVGDGEGLESLELLAVDLKKTQIEKGEWRTNLRPLESAAVNFSALRRLKIRGQSNHLALTDDDLCAIARTATNLEALHITRTSSVAINGVGALIDASRNTLQVLDFSPTRDLSLARQTATEAKGSCDQISECIHQCRHLRDISITLPSICPALFADAAVRWEGEMQVRASAICSHSPNRIATSSGTARKELFRTLDTARALMAARELEDINVTIEITLGSWLFVPRSGMVHGNFALGRAMADGTWPMSQERSGKGGYWQGEGESKEGDWTAITERDFEGGCEGGYVNF